ncbi:DMT family transporter [Desulfotomaculum nigrificans]|uniref:DMT family transporter n=1 Tax=Desulfotomaculum nigrificans TaxID=1565 RepID=UPI0001FAECD7|nr:DMT family transporter [Desulfotomaculum nigrificans]
MSVKEKSQVKSRQLIGILLVIISTISLSTEAVAAKISYQGGATVITALTIRYLLATLLFGAILIITKTSIKLPLKQTLTVLALAIGGQATIALALFNSFKYIPAAIAILLLYVYPTITSILSFFILKEPLHRRKWLALILTLTGCVIILGQPIENLQPLGVVLALLAALLNALFLVLSSKLLDQVSVPVFNTYITGTCAVVFLVLGYTMGELQFHLTAKSWAALLVLAVVTTVIAMGTLFKGVTIIGPSRAAIISTLEPAFTGLLGWLLLGETLTGWQVVGGIIILCGVLLQREEPEVHN